jgi:hypothetical protein
MSEALVPVGGIDVHGTSRKTVNEKPRKTVTQAMVCPLLRVIIACFLQSYGCFCVWLVCCGNLLISRIARHFIPSVQSFAIKKGSAFWANVSQQVDVMTANLACSFSFAMWLMYCVFLFVKVNGASALRASIRVSLLFTLINL